MGSQALTGGPAALGQHVKSTLLTSSAPGSTSGPKSVSGLGSGSQPLRLGPEALVSWPSRGRAGSLGASVGTSAGTSAGAGPGAVVPRSALAKDSPPSPPPHAPPPLRSDQTPVPAQNQGRAQGRARRGQHGSTEGVPVAPQQRPPGIPRDLAADRDRLQRLISLLACATSDSERDAILRSDPRVQSVFPPPAPTAVAGAEASGGGVGGAGSARFVKPAVRAALEHLTLEEQRLLMLLAAAGQEHLLDTPLGWGEEEEGEEYSAQYSTGDTSGLRGEGRSIGRGRGTGNGPWEGGAGVGMDVAPEEGVKGALTMLGSMIEGWQANPSSVPKEGTFGGVPTSKDAFAELLQTFGNPGVFPTPVLQLMDWEGRKAQPSPKPSPSSSPSSLPSNPISGSEGTPPVMLFGQGDPQDFLRQFLDAFDNPGVFPVPILEMFDIEGRSAEGTLDAWLGLIPSEEERRAERDHPAQQALGEMRRLVTLLRRMERFYDSIGGILGYQAVTLDLICAEEAAKAETARLAAEQQEREAQGLQGPVQAGTGARAGAVALGQQREAQSGRTLFSMPPGEDLAANPEFALRAALWGIEGLPGMAEMYPLGGAGDRLGLVDGVTGEPLPVAMLQYCGRTLLEGLIRDLQAREYLHFRLFGERHVTPVAIMTSAAKKNNSKVRGLCQGLGWFGRGADSFFLFEQPLVPAVAAEDGRWPASAPLQPVLKPGGHGVMWKLAADEGVLDWLATTHRRKATLIRQISNPMAGTDVTLLALAGVGLMGNKKFGFASCDRNVGAAEGVNVLAERQREDGQWECGITCVEYTEFEKLGIADTPVSSGSMRAQLPANTNVLYADLEAVRGVVQGGGPPCTTPTADSSSSSATNASSATATYSSGSTTGEGGRASGAGALGPAQAHEGEARERSNEALGGGLAALPGMILNLKKPINYCCHQGLMHSVRAGRLECTMQNLADSLTTTLPGRLRDLPATQQEQEPQSVEGPGNHAAGMPGGASRLDTFLVFNDRRKVTSSAKRRRKPGEMKLHQTPEGSFLDLNRNSRELFLSCGVDMPVMEGNQCYVDTSPPFILLFHPALGPLWEVIRQKVKGGSIASGSEVLLEVAELAWKDVQVAGSLVVAAGSVMGSLEENEKGEPILQYGLRCGRCRLENVRVENRGVFWEHPDNIFWQHRVVRHESLRVVLHGDAEFEARDVTIKGSHLFEVPAGHRMLVTADAGGEAVARLEKLQGGQPSWMWHFSASRHDEEKAFIKLRLVETN